MNVWRSASGIPHSLVNKQGNKKLLNNLPRRTELNSRGQRRMLISLAFMNCDLFDLVRGDHRVYSVSWKSEHKD